MIMDLFNITNQFLNCSSQFLDNFATENFLKSNSQITLEIGTNIIKMLSFISQVNLNSKTFISQEIHPKSIIMLILWTLDTFPLTNFKYQEVFHKDQSGMIPKESSVFLFKNDMLFEFIEEETFKDSYFFTKKTIDSKLIDQISEADLIQTLKNEKISETNESNNTIKQVAVNTIDGKEIQLRYNYKYTFLLNKDDNYDEYISLSKYFKEQHIALITTIRFFLDQMSSDKINFINDFVFEYFTTMDQIFNKDRSIYDKFQIVEHCLPLSFHFFMILLFTQFKSNRIFDIISSHPKGWPTIFNKAFFSPLINHWADLTPYFQFCFDIRSAIKNFTLRCFTLSKNENSTLFSTLHNFFYSVEPQIFDEAIDIFSQLFKVKPDEFVEIASQTGVIEMLIYNSDKLLKLHIHLIRTKNKMEKFVEQTRVHLFSFIDLFLTETPSTEYFFKNEFYVKYLLSLLFEKNVTLFAIKLIQRGMLLSNTTEIFNSIHYLFQISLKKLNDMSWIKMLNFFLVNIRSPFISNRSAIMHNLINKEILLQISQMPDAVILSNPSFFHVNINTESSDLFELHQILAKSDENHKNCNENENNSLEDKNCNADININNNENKNNDDNINTDQNDKNNEKNNLGIINNDNKNNERNENNDNKNNDNNDNKNNENNNNADNTYDISKSKDNGNFIYSDDKINNKENNINNDKVDSYNNNKNDNEISNIKLKENNSLDLDENFTVDPNSEQVQIIRNVLFIIIILTRGSQINASCISSNEFYLSNISKALSRFKYGSEIINLLLELIFEKQMDIDNLPKKAEIQNHYALPFFFNSTKHLQIHGKLMRYLADILSDSISNRLRAYQANIPNIIIDRITQFPIEPTTGTYLEKSLTESLHLFSVISQFVFSVSTLYKCIRSFKPINDDSQTWWTAQLISLFNIYVENSFYSLPAAFFYLDGFQTYFSVPSFSASLISKGFTFVCRLQLDSNSSNSSNKSTLLYMESVSGFIFEILFVNMYLKVKFYSDQKKNQAYTIRNGTFSGNKWYDIIVTFSKSSMIVFMNGKQIFGLEMKYPFKEDIKYCTIANNRHKNSPLIANISCFYFLNDAINSWTALEFHSLPLDFVFGFSTLEKLLDPNLPNSLFDGRIESMLFIGANARMTNQSECLNFATRNSIGNATYKGFSFPFSVSFIDVVGYSGGAKLFLPLFEQINSKIYGSDDSQIGNSNFLCNLLSLLAAFFVHSLSIETEFVKDGGFQALSSLFTKVNTKYLNQSFIQELHNLWFVINQQHCEVMLKTIWLNFLLWDTLPNKSQKFLYSKVFSSIVESKGDLVSANLSITEFLTVIARQKNDKIRYFMWPSLIVLARNSFNKKAQDSHLSACFYVNMETKSTSFQIEALNLMYILVTEKVNNCHLLFLRNATFRPFLQLMHSPYEEIRIWGLKFLFLINSFDEYKEVQFNDSIYRVCVEVNPKNMTKRTWNTLISLSFENNKLLPTIKYTLPLLCAFSHYFQKEEIDMLANKLLNAPNLFLIAECKNWIFWIFYMIDQLSLSFNSNHPLFKLIENLCAYLAINEKFNKFNMAMAFIRSLSFQMNMDMTVLLNNIFKTIIKLTISLINNPDLNKNSNDNSIIIDNNLNLANRISPSLFNLIIQEVIFYLFFISKNESYSLNVQLLAKHNVHVYESVQMKFIGHETLKSFAKLFNDIEISPLVLSARINAKGEWIDMDLALIFIDFLSLFTADKVPVQLPYQRIRTEDIFAYVASFIIRADREGDGSQITNVIMKINKFFDNKEILESSRKIIACFLSNIVCKSNKKEPNIKNGSKEEKPNINGNENENESNNQNININNNYNNEDNENDARPINNNNNINESKNNEILNNQQNKNIPFVIFGVQFNQEHRQSDYLSKWLELFESLGPRYFEVTRSVITVLWSHLKPMLTVISLDQSEDYDYSLLFDSQSVHTLSKQKRRQLILSKMTSRLLTKIKENGGPWDEINGPIHWKYWRRMDKFYRHILMKPNKKFFDRHDKAAQTRDRTLKNVNSLQYDDLIESQILSKSNLLTKSLLDIDASDEKSEFSNENNKNEDNNQIISNFDAVSKMITISGIYEGTFYISKKLILFTGDKISDDFGITLEEKDQKQKTKTVQIDLDNLTWVLHRSYVHIDQGLEFFLNNGLSYFFFFTSQKVRQKIIQFLGSSKKPEILQDCSSMKLVSDQKITEKWVNGYISTYEYIMLVNFFSGRTFNDLSQYPIFPWIISDYDRSHLDLNDPTIYRDLSKPIGALNEERLIKLKREYAEIIDDSSKCLYRGHYSTSYNVIHYMIRVEPFTTLHVQVQKGRFDFPSRLFTSIPRAYKTCTSTANDYRELIPEFFTLPDFLVNKNNFNLGIEGGNDVVLPRWASSPADFIIKHREALESDFVGMHINEWIDLVFGYKQKGKNAVEADNTFHAYCYEESVTKKIMEDQDLLLEIQQHAGSFGIIPRQVFVKKHPARLLTDSYVKSPSFDKTLLFSAIYQIDTKIHHNDHKVKNIGFGDNIQKNAPKVNKIVSLNMSGNDIQVLTSNRSLILLSNIDKSNQFGNLTNISVPFYVETQDSQHMNHNLICYFKQFGVFVAISPPEDSFHAYSITESFVLNHIFSFRQKYSSLTLISAADENTLLLLSQDGTINVWSFIRNNTNNIINSIGSNNANNTNGIPNINNNGNNIDIDLIRNKCQADAAFNYNGKEFSIIQKFRRNHHFITTKDAFGNGNLGLIASCDVNQRIILTDLNNGSFLRSWLINGKSLYPQRVLVLDSGFITVLCETGSQNAKRTVIQCFTIDAEITGAYDHIGFAVSWIPINFRNGTSFIAVSYEDGDLLILHIPNLKVMMEINFTTTITGLSFNLENRSLLLSNIKGQVLIANL